MIEIYIYDMQQQIYERRARMKEKYIHMRKDILLQKNIAE